MPGRCQGWRLSAFLFALGGLTGWLHAPYNFWWVSLFTFPFLFVAVSEAISVRSAFGRGWVFAFGYFIFGLYWIANALFVDIAQFWWALPLAVAALPMGLALFWGAAAGITHKWGGRGFSQLLCLAALLLLAEWLRGHVFTGFPWLLLGYVWIDVEPVRALAAAGGIYGLTLWALLLALLPAVFLMTLTRSEKRGAAALAVVLVALPLLNPLPTSLGDEGSIRLRLVQPNIAQSMKLDPAAREATLQQLTALTQQPGNPQLVIWPETAVPYLLAERVDIRARLAAALPAGSTLVTGAVRHEEQKYYNSVMVMSGQGEVTASYDKAHLVPFGEYIPLRDYLPFDPVAGGENFSPGPGPHAVAVSGLPSFGPLVCYEIIFPGQVVSRNDVPEWLLNVTNDGWYGTSHGPYQHFEIARLRAVEEGLPVVRVANTGISGAIDAAGNVIAATQLAEAKYIDVTLNIIPLATLYRKWGDGPALFIAVLLALPAGRRRFLATSSSRP